MSDSYTFGDSAVAAARLGLLARAFERTTRRFLRRHETRGCGLVVDLGCGPGFTTALLNEVLAPERLVGVDASAPFVREATARLSALAEVLHADVLALPDQVRDADVVFARFLLTHLSDPDAALEHWLGRLAPNGVLLVEEVESITTGEPALSSYLDLQRRMLNANRNRLEIGPVLEPAARRHGQLLHSAVVSTTPPTAVAARLFAMNFASWRARPEVLALTTPQELDAIASGLDALMTSRTDGASITWQLRQVSVSRA